MHGKFGMLSHGKASSHSTALSPPPPPPPPTMYAVFSCLHTTGCKVHYFTTDGNGIVNVRTHLGSCRTHERGVRDKQVCTRVDSEGHENCPSPCPARGTNPGSSDLNSDSLTTELLPGPTVCTFSGELHLISDKRTGRVILHENDEKSKYISVIFH